MFSTDPNNQQTMSIKIHAIWLFVCLLGNLIHLNEILENYFKYEISADVRILRNKTFEIPGMTFCFPKPVAINWSSMNNSLREQIFSNTGLDSNSILADCKKYENETSESVLNSISSYASNRIGIFLLGLSKVFSVPVDMFPVTHKFIPGIVENVLFTHFDTVTKKIHYERACGHECSEQDSSFLDVTQYFMGYMYTCYKLQFKIGNGVIDTKQLMSRGGIWLTMNIEPWATKLEYGTCMPDDMLTMSSMRLNINVNAKVIIITHTVFESNLQKAPYTTNCRNYKEMGLISSSDCYHSCIKTLGIINDNKLTENSNIYENDSLPQSDSENYSSYCISSCEQEDCHSIISVPKIQSIKPSNSNWTLIQFTLPEAPLTRIVYRPAVTFITFFTNSLSTFGFWLGVSIFGSFSYSKKLLSFITPFMEKNSRRTTIQEFHENVEQTNRINYSDCCRLCRRIALQTATMRRNKRVSPNTFDVNC